MHSPANDANKTNYETSLTGWSAKHGPPVFGFFSEIRVIRGHLRFPPARIFIGRAVK
jgi:hypothetical protein